MLEADKVEILLKFCQKYSVQKIGATSEAKKLNTAKNSHSFFHNCLVREKYRKCVNFDPLWAIVFMREHYDIVFRSIIIICCYSQFSHFSILQKSV